MKKGEIYEGKVIKTTFPNKGIVFIDDKKITVKGALTGQNITFSIKKNRADHAEGRLLKVNSSSPLEDTNPICPHFNQCGGCTYQSLSYTNQLNLKESQVKELLDSLEIPYIWEGIKGSPVQEEYRNKMEFSFGDEYKDGPLALGMHKKNSFHDIVSIEQCKIVPEDYNMILKATLDYCTQKEYPFYKKMLHTGLLRHLVIRRSVKSNDILVNIVTTDSQPFDSKEYVKVLLDLKINGTIIGIIHTINNSLADVVQSDKMTLLYGNDYFIENILNLNFRVSPFSFFQTNSLGAEVLYETARSYVGETKDKVIFDLYSGTGTIAQILAPTASKVIGIEIIEEAVEAAKINANLNKLHNCEFIAGDVLSKIDEINVKPDIIVVDPPRSGINPKAIKKIAGYGIDEIIYISCNPASLTNDIKEFSQYGYKLKRACAVDMFPNTVHVETVALLSIEN